MPNGDAFGKLKHSIAFVDFVEPLITLAISGVIVEQKIANVQQPAGPQHAFDLSQEPSLIFIRRNAGQHGEE